MARRETVPGMSVRTRLRGVFAVKVAAVAMTTVAVLAARFALTGATGIGVGFLLVVPVGLATWWFGRRVGFILAAAAIALWLGAWAAGAGLVAGGWEAAMAMRAAALVVTVFVVGSLRESLSRLVYAQAELGALHDALSPARIPRLPGLEIAVTFRPAEHEVAGDFYLVQAAQGRNVIILGDVVGHGIRAAREATFARALLGSMASGTGDPGAILGLANGVLCEAWETEDFLTAVCLVHDPAAGTLFWACAGHPAPVSLVDGRELNGDHGGPPLGISPGATYKTRETTLRPGDGVVVYTDGLIEAKRDGMMLGVPRVLELVRLRRSQTPGEIVGALEEIALDFTRGHLSDDMCIIALRMGEVGTYMPPENN